MESRGAHGDDDGGVHRNLLERVRARLPPAGLGCCRRCQRDPGVLHEGGGRVLRGCDRPGSRHRWLAAGLIGPARSDSTQQRRGPTRRPDPEARRAALWTLAGLAVAGGLFLLFFVLPYWQEFRFYNWQMSVTRKPTYGLHALVDRASWLPVVHDFFTRQWLITVAALAGCFGLLVRWRSASGPERLLGLWIVLGILEMIVHDVGNERRYIFLIPAFVVLAALVVVRDRRLVPEAAATLPRARDGWRSRSCCTRRTSSLARSCGCLSSTTCGRVFARLRQRQSS